MDTNNNHLLQNSKFIILIHWNNILSTVFFSLINPAVGGWFPVYKFLIFKPK